MFTLNRQAIRKSLAAYYEAERQQKAILEDREIQSHFERDEEEKARALIQKRYPEGVHTIKRKRAHELINLMTKGIPAYKGIDPQDIYCNIDIWNDLLKLAESI